VITLLTISCRGIWLNIIGHWQESFHEMTSFILSCFHLKYVYLNYVVNSNFVVWKFTFPIIIVIVLFIWGVFIWTIFIWTMVIFISVKNESKLRPCGQLSKCVGPLGAVPMQTAKGGGQLLIRVRGPDANGPNWPRFGAKMRRAVGDALRLHLNYCVFQEVGSPFYIGKRDEGRWQGWPPPT
jgi:hypothetical protein